jgi:hypothetical protein
MFVSDPPGDIFCRSAPPRYQRSAARIIVGPSGKGALPKKILIIQAEFFQARARDVRELELHLFRSSARFASFGNVLHAAPGGLHHLVMGAAARIDVSITKAHRHIVAKLSDLEALQLTIAAMPRN